MKLSLKDYNSIKSNSLLSNIILLLITIQLFQLSLCDIQDEFFLNSQLQQSPIEIPPKDELTKLNKDIIKINYQTVEGQFNYEPVGEGNTFKLITSADDFSHEISFYDTVIKRNVSYYLRNIHFHVPEEHFMDSKKYPIEFHFVHSTKDPNESEYSNLVLGVLGRETFDIQASSLIKGISLDEGSLSTLIMKPLVGKSYYFYHGSLTTPPYSENVLWFVFKDVINVGSSFINLAKDKIVENARDLQDNEGEVYIFNNKKKKIRG